MSTGFGSDGISFINESEEEVRPPGDLKVVGSIPLLVDQQWRNAALLNSTEYDGDAWAIYRDDRLPSRVGYATWSERFPSGSPATDAMPKANVAAAWGDFLVLGDIVWKANPSNPLDEGNAVRYPHGLWYSQPGTLDSWDELDVEFIGQRSGGNTVVGLFPIEAGLLVAATSGIYLLRGTPDDHEPYDVRVGVGPRSRATVANWPMVGAVVWMDARGQVWQTNGEQFGRLDEPLPVYSGDGTSDAVGVLDNHLLVSRGGRLFVLRVEPNGGAWTELNGPAAQSIVGYRGSLYMRGPDGVFRWGPEVRSQRGHRDGEPVTSEVATATLAGADPHEVAFWHRFGLRASGGRLLRAVAKAGPWSSSAPTLEVDSPEMGGEHDLAVWPAHGPSPEASFGWLAEGNITYESATVWAHQGRPSR